MDKTPLVSEQVYHIYSKSIADYVVFNSTEDFRRMQETLRFYKDANARSRGGISNPCRKENPLVQIICYCLMGTHLHLVLKQLVENGISIFMNRVLNSYSRYFNERHERKGPLWEGRFKRILVDNESYLLHLTRYIHLNPVTAHLVDLPENWEFSSFNEYIQKGNFEKLCEFEKIIEMNPSDYRDFVNSRIEDQRKLAAIKHLIIDHDTTA